MFISEAWAQAAAGGGGGDMLQQMIPLVLIFVVFYFLLIRPQQKKAREHRELISNVRRGDLVVTGGGLLGKVIKVHENEVEIELSENVRVRALKGTIQTVLARGEPTAKETASANAANDQAKPAGLLGMLFPGRKK